MAIKTRAVFRVEFTDGKEPRAVIASSHDQAIYGLTNIAAVKNVVQEVYEPISPEPKEYVPEGIIEIVHD